jgi:DMSO/TMAO reductase YedYZ molybdopterin-dependent catalytic subunit
MSDARTSERTAGPGSVEIITSERHSYDLSELRTLPRAERFCTVACASGERTTARWIGVPVAELLSRVDASLGTTHLQLDSYDGYRICVPIHDALEGLIAYARDGEALSNIAPYRTRFVASGVDGERLVKGVRWIELLSLAADEDPDRLENVTLDDPGYG